jgi:hypothetical protein
MACFFLGGNPASEKKIHIHYLWFLRTFLSVRKGHCGVMMSTSTLTALVKGSCDGGDELWQEEMFWRQ